jgi:hypothetical protein
MGIVYRAVDARLGRTVAIKTLPAEATADADRIRRFVQEARAASSLNHPNIVTIYDIDEHEGTTFIAMELVDGTPLDRMIASGPLPIAETLDHAAQVASALEAAHASGIIHRDIKPANIMITRDGRAKVLDFGLAKLIERDVEAATRTTLGTRPGIVLGTAAYMSPEQAEGRVVNAQSDIFSFGAVLYEMLAGRRPFTGDSDLGIITAILRDDPPPLRRVRADVPSAVQTIVERCLAKDPVKRYADAGALRTDLLSAHARLTRPADATWRRPAVLVPVALVLLAAGGYGVWQTLTMRRVRWVQLEAIPEIERLIAAERPIDAMMLARDAERFSPGDVARIRQGWYRINLVTEPPGASVHVDNYLGPGGRWAPLGATPLHEPLLPYGSYRMRITKDGYVPVEISAGIQPRSIALAPVDQAPDGMTLVKGGPFSVGVARRVVLPDFWIDKQEVTNREFKRFVDAGGYRNAKYWKERFGNEGRELSFDEAMGRFRDGTGQTGPATWELGSYPEGHADFPVAGISWFEALAYANFVGKTLPTVYHWYRAAPPDELSSDILRLSNFDGKGPLKAGTGHGLGPWGTFDMAGNVKEWCANQVEGTTLRFILGGGWNEPSYRYIEPDAQNPWDRQGTFGMRLVKDLGPAPHAAAPVARVYGDPNSVVPVSDELFEGYRRSYTYDRTPLNARVENTDDSSPYWRKETLSFDAAYAGERVPAYLFLPKNATAPYQTIVLFPSGFARAASTSRELDFARFDFIIRSGRALIYPVYQGTFERRRPESGGPNEMRDLHVQWAKDFFRAVDYLETRPDIDKERLGYYSLSMGAYFGPIPVALEPRIKVAVFAAGGLRFGYPPEIQPANFMPRVTVPVLLINGRDDFQTPLEAQRRLIELLGTPPERKRHVALEGGHVPNDFRGFVREVLDWFDRYLGPAR